MLEKRTMLLKFNSKHKSIPAFEDTEIDNFTIITGKNGSGKTQLLESIRDGHTQVMGIQLNEIQYFNYSTFQIPKEQLVSTENIKREKIGLWQRFVTQPAKNKPYPKGTFQQFKSNILSEEVKKLEDISNEKNKPLLLLDLEDVDHDNNLFQKLKNYRQNVEQLKNTKQYDLRILELSFNYTGFVDDITQEEFMEKINIHTSEHNFFANQISRIFLNFNHLCTLEYAKLLEENKDKQIIPITYKEKAVEIVLKKFGGKYPWDYINDLFELFDDFKYKISRPDEFELKDLDDTQSKEFIATLYNEQTNLVINFDELSSGEKTLLTITLMLFNTVLTKHFPKLVLLDEIDSSLHPSMTKDLLLSLQNIFVNNGINVILVTHSPSTIAFAQKNSIYVADNSTKEFIKKTDQNTALQILTQGYMTIEEGIKLFDQLSKKEISIITEGKNTEYIKKAIEFFAGENKNKIDVIVGAESGSGDRQLKTVFDFFKLVDHSNKILFVWDCDANNCRILPEKNNTYRFVFEKNIANQLIPNGIENLFGAEHFQEFKREIIDKRGEVVQIKYHLDKEKFKNKILQEGQEEFVNFKPLFECIDKLINNN